MKRNLIFETKAQVRSDENGYYKIDNSMIYSIDVEAENIEDALEIYRQEMDEQNCIEISKNAVKARKPLTIYTKNGEHNIGYRMTGRCRFYNSKNPAKTIYKYVDLEVKVITDVDVLTVYPKRHNYA